MANDACRYALPALAMLILGAAGASAQTIAMVAVDFPKLTGGPADFYVDAKNKALAINAANTAFRSKWAVAEMPFAGAAATYDIILHSMYESDGESHYALRIGNDSIGGFQNPSAYTGNKLTTPDYTIYKHTFKDVQVTQGAAIKVYGMTHSNGKVPEDGGFAWSRGRWSRLEFVRKSATGLVAEGGRAPRAFLAQGRLSLSGLEPGPHAVRVLNPNGRLVSEFSAAPSRAGRLELPLGQAVLAPGNYPVRISGPGGDPRTFMIGVAK